LTIAAICIDYLEMEKHMRYAGNVVSGLVGAVVSLVLASTLVAQTPVESTAKVIRMKGAVRYSTGNNVWQTAEVGMILRPGSIVQVGSEAGCFVDLALDESSGNMEVPATYRPYIPTSLSTSTSTAVRPSAEQNVVRLWENTVMAIDRLTTQTTGADVVTDTQLDLKAGRISGSVKKMSAGSRYEVKLPNGVAGIRGTSYDLAVEGVVRVFAGSVLFGWGSPQVAQLVSEGNQYDGRTGQMSAIPQTILQMFQQIFSAMRFVAPAAPTTYAADKTVNNVSPVVGQ
jgi:hypothetical protein